MSTSLSIMSSEARDTETIPGSTTSVRPHRHVANVDIQSLGKNEKTVCLSDLYVLDI